MSHANPGIHHLQLGEMLVSALNDGQFEAANEWIINIPLAEWEPLVQGTFRPLPPRITVSCFLVRAGGQHVLIDCGGGGAFGNLLGHAPARLAAAGIDAGAIDAVLVTHAHVDHISGLLAADGSAAFPNAEVVLSAAEHGFWFGEGNAARAPESAQDYFRIAARALGPYAARTRLVADGDTAVPGITARALPGHTPGHTGWLLASGAASLLIWGDVVHLPAIQFPRPDAGMAFDVDPAEARATRARTFDMAASDKVMVAGMHLDFPTFGHVARRGTGYAFEPIAWAPTAAGLVS